MNILDIYKGLVPFLGEALGKDCEVVLHDFREPGHSVIVIAIANGNISGRHVGAPVTDFILKLLQMDKKQHQQSETIMGKVLMDIHCAHRRILSMMNRAKASVPSV